MTMPSNTASNGGICVHCGAFIPNGEIHHCPHGNPVPPITPRYPFALCECGKLLPELKRIADALEKLVASQSKEGE